MLHSRIPLTVVGAKTDSNGINLKLFPLSPSMACEAEEARVAEEELFGIIKFQTISIPTKDSICSEETDD